MRQAARISANRTVAGVHFPVDSMAGAMLGTVLGNWMCALADVKAKGGSNPRAFNVFDFDGNAVSNGSKKADQKYLVDFNPSTFIKNGYLTHADASQGFSDLSEIKLSGKDEARHLNWLWQEAVDEFSK